MDIMTVLGIIIAIGAIAVGQSLEGGHLGSILQLTAFIIVIGGTLGACIVQNSMPVLIKSVKMLRLAFFNPEQNSRAIIRQIVDLANVARKLGLLALEAKLKEVRDPFFRKGIQLIVDGTEAKLVQEVLEVEVDQEEEEGITGAKVWEAAGGYSPTIGILGAVLGLIHVMENLADPDKLGGGIAVAFVATVYGVGAANLLFLPLASKMKLRVKNQTRVRSMVIAGLVGVAQGDNPRILEEKMEGYLPEHQRTKR